MSSLSCLSLSLVLTVALSKTIDQGYLDLFETHNETWEETCWDTGGASIPSYVNGTFIIPALGQFEMGGYAFEGLLDPFGKLHRFTFKENGAKMCSHARMMDTTFYNNSIDMGRIAPNLLFTDTKPPSGYSGIQNLGGPQDNLFVNSYKIGSKFRLKSDTPKVLEFDPMSLRMTKNVTWKDSLDRLVLGLGSAHQLPDPSNSDCIIDLHPQMGMMHKEVVVYRVCPQDPYTRQHVNSYDNHYMPYFHSFGLTKSALVLLHMHFTLNMMAVFQKGGTLATAFQPVDVGKDTAVMVMPLDGSAAIPFSIPGDIYFTHSINAYSNETATIWDFCAFDENPFLHATTLSVYRNKTARDAADPGLRGIPKRLVMHTSGPLKGQATIAEMGPPTSKITTDFPSINPRFASKPYCYFWGNEWYHDGKSYASLAVVKWDLCSGTTAKKSYFYRENAYPSEPKMIPDASGKEDEGIIIFTLYDGEAGSTSVVLLNAQTLDVVYESKGFGKIGFTTHGEFYSGL